MSPLESTEQCHIKVINQSHLSVYVLVHIWLCVWVECVLIRPDCLCTSQVALVEVTWGPMQWKRPKVYHVCFQCNGRDPRCSMSVPNAVEEAWGMGCLFPMQWKRPMVWDVCFQCNGRGPWCGMSLKKKLKQEWLLQCYLLTFFQFYTSPVSSPFSVILTSLIFIRS